MVIIPEGMTSKLDVLVQARGVSKRFSWPVSWITGTKPPKKEVVLSKVSDRVNPNIGRIATTGSVVVLAVAVIGKYSRGAYEYVKDRI